MYLAIMELHDIIDYILSHFVAMKMRPVSAFDPSGFIIIIASGCLFFGVLTGLIVHILYHEDTKKLRDGATLSMQEATESMKQKVKHMSSYVQKTSARQGFISEMLSYEYLSRLGFSLLLFIIASYLNALAAVIAGWRTPHVIILNLNNEDSKEKTLPDLGHDLFKYTMKGIYGDTGYIDWFDLPDTFIAITGSIVAVFIIAHPKRLLILRRLTAIFAVINLFRACCVAVTSLPDASPQCISQFYNENGIYKNKPIFPMAFYRAFKVLLRPSRHITCGDMVFSGHTVFLILCAMIVKTYCNKHEADTPFTRKYDYVLGFVRIIIYVSVFGAIFAIIGTRLHYTLDVLIAIFVTFQVWTMYHWRARGFVGSISIMDWLEHSEVHEIDSHAYRRARRKGSVSDEECVKTD